MPELPEVETTMRALRVRLEGRRIVRATLHRTGLRWPFPPDLADRLRDRRVLGFRRRGKYMLMRLDDRRSLLIHLGMSGRLLLDRAPADGSADRDGEVRPAHAHAEFLIEDGWRVTMVDPRRFGALDLLPTADEDRHRLLAELGPEPLEPGFDGHALARRLAGRVAPLKAVLLDQRTVAGLGNIYVCEALFRAGLSPSRAAADAVGPRSARLVAAIRSTLTDAIAAGGSSLRDYVQPDGELGFFQQQWRVYGRAGLPCERCPGAPRCAGIARRTEAGRSTFFCPRLQR